MTVSVLIVPWTRNDTWIEGGFYKWFIGKGEKGNVKFKQYVNNDKLI